jgi:drug/metabolite transporter (DMT)-like permease
MIGVLGGLLAAVMWGSSTVVASRSTRMIGSQQALAYVMLSGLALTLPLALLVDGVPGGISSRAWAWAVVGGFASVGGLSMMYRALRIGKVGVVSPVASTEGALAAVFAIALGEDVTAAIAVALMVVAVGVVVVTFHAKLSDVHLRPVLYALCAAVIFGVGLVASARAGDDLGAFWTILVARIVGVAFLAAPLALRGALPLPGRALPLVAYSGTAEVAGFAGYIVGAQHGIAVAAVLAAQFAAVAALLSYVAFDERLTPRQLAGVAIIIAGVTAVTAVAALRA